MLQWTQRTRNVHVEERALGLEIILYVYYLISKHVREFSLNCKELGIFADSRCSLNIDINLIIIRNFLIEYLKA